MTTRTGVLVICVALAAFGGGFVAARATSLPGPAPTVEVNATVPLPPLPSPIEMVYLIVAAKDLPAGSIVSKDDIPGLIKIKKVAKDAIPPGFVLDESELVGKRLARAIRMDEPFSPSDLQKGFVVIPSGMDMMSIALGLPEAVSGFVVPGTRVDILASLKLKDRHVAVPLLVDMLVLAVDKTREHPKIPEADGLGEMTTVSLAVNREQALLLQLARSRECKLSLVLRGPDKAEAKETWSLDDARRLLASENFAAEPEVP